MDQFVLAEYKVQVQGEGQMWKSWDWEQVPIKIKYSPMTYNLLIYLI